MNNNAQTETTVLKNIKNDLVEKMNELIEQSERDQKHQSEILSEKYFQINAYVKFCSLLSDEISEIVKRIEIVSI